MNTTFTLLLIAAALAVANSASIRGSSVQIQSQDQRHLMEESTCKLFQKCVTFLATDEHPNGHHEESWVCELSPEDSARTGVQFVDIVESPSIAPSIKTAKTGESTLTVTEAIIDTESPRMYIPESAHVAVKDATAETHTEKRRRSLTSNGPSSMGTLKALVIRIIGSNGAQPSLSTEKLANDVFEDSVSLSSQTKACSYNKLNIEPFIGTTPKNRQISNGVVNVQIDSNSEVGLDQAAMTAANDQLGDLNDPMFDLVMFCFPQGTQGFVAFAYPHSKFSFYNDQWCGFVSAQMHEVGHNLGLAHSGEVGDGAYGDGTGMMGNAQSTDDMSRCYNAQKSYQLGWYEDKVETINPIDGTGIYEFVLNGVSDYEKNNDAIIVLRLEQTSMEQDYYIGFNRASGINKDTTEDRDMVTITSKDFGAPDKYGQSTKIWSLSPGERYVIQNFNNQRDVEIVFVSLENGDAKILIIDEPQVNHPSEHCKKYTIELITDSSPNDSLWYITNSEQDVAVLSPVYKQANKRHLQEVCLPMVEHPKPYTFTKRGRGLYKIYNDKNEEIFDRNDASFILIVPKDPQPPFPTKPPTASPTAKPTPAPPCHMHTIEVKTDDFPSDNSWEIVYKNEFQEEILIQTSPKFELGGHVYMTQVCLNAGKKYEFRFADSHGDGICCNFGKGYYRVVEDCSGKEIVGSGMNNALFETKTHTIDTISECRAETDPGNEETQCRDKKEGRWKYKRNRKKRTCKFLARKNKCDLKLRSGHYVWQQCQKSCNRCD